MINYPVVQIELLIETLRTGTPDKTDLLLAAEMLAAACDAKKKDLARKVAYRQNKK